MPPRVLLVAEEPVLAEITRFRLELLGFDVAVCETAEDALQRLRTDRFALMLVDQMLSGIDGTALINRIRNDELTHNIPVILISNSAELDQVQRAFVAGANEYLVTPYDPMVLERKIQNLVSEVI